MVENHSNNIHNGNEREKRRAIFASEKDKTTQAIDLVLRLLQTEVARPSSRNPDSEVEQLLSYGRDRLEAAKHFLTTESDAIVDVDRHSSLRFSVGRAEVYARNAGDRPRQQLLEDVRNIIFLVDRATLPAVEASEVQSVSEPAWSAQALETMSEPDRKTIYKLRNSFAQRGEHQQWYYGASGTDVVPVLIAPQGTTHHFVDPNLSDRDLLKTRLEGSFLASGEGTAHQTDAGHMTSTLEGGSAIAWHDQEMEDLAEIPDYLDVVYTNFISQEPGAAILDRLRTNGLLVFDGPPRKQMEMLNHPAGFKGLTTELGFRVVAEAIRIDKMNPQRGQSLLRYGYDAPATFTVLEKTREFTQRDRCDLMLNEYAIKLYTQLKSLIFHLPKFRSGGVEREQQIRYTKESIGSFYEKFKQQIATLSPEDFVYMQMTWEGKFKKLFTRGALGDVTAWLIQVDHDSGSADTSRKLKTREDYQYFAEALIEIVPFVDDCNQTLFAA